MKNNFNNRKLKFFILGIIFLFIVFPAFSYEIFKPYQTMNPYSTSKISLEENVVLIPTGTEIPVVTVDEINPNFLILGQTISVMLNNDYYYGGKFVAPVGSTISGTVVKIEQAKGNKAFIPDIKFTALRSPYGQTIPLSAKVKLNSETKVHNVDKTENYVTLNNIGDVVIPVNTPLMIELEQPITINASNAYRY